MDKKTLASCGALFLLTAGTSAFAVETMKPGLWEITSQMDGAGMPAMPAMPPEHMARMKEMGIKMPGMGGQGMSITVRHCVTKEQAEKGVPPQPKNDRHCEQKSVKREGNKISWSMECTGEHPVSGTGSVVFESPERYQGESTINMKEAKRGAMAMKQSYRGKWLSASCEKQ